MFCTDSDTYVEMCVCVSVPCARYRICSARLFLASQTYPKIKYNTFKLRPYMPASHPAAASTVAAMLAFFFETNWNGMSVCAFRHQHFSLEFFISLFCRVCFSLLFFCSECVCVCECFSCMPLSCAKCLRLHYLCVSLIFFSFSFGGLLCTRRWISAIRTHVMAVCMSACAMCVRACVRVCL